MPHTTHPMFPRTLSEGNALLKRSAFLAKALKDFEERPEQTPFLDDMKLAFAQAASNGEPATQAEMEAHYLDTSFTGLSQTLFESVKLHKVLKERALFLLANTRIFRVQPAYMRALEKTTGDLAKAIPTFYHEAKGFLNCLHDKFGESAACDNDQKLDANINIFRARQDNRCLTPPEKMSTPAEHVLTCGHHALDEAKALRGCLISGLSLMQKEIGFYGYVYGDSDYQQKVLGECVRVDTRAAFCETQKRRIKLWMDLLTAYGNAQAEIKLLKLPPEPGARPPRALMH